ELMTIRENERAALARDLHDGLGQYLTGLRAQTWMIPLKANDKTGLEDLASQIGSTCEALDQGFRHLIRSQYPVALEQTGLKAAVFELLKEVSTAQKQIALTVSGDGWDNWPLATQSHLYRLIQEAINNSVRHAGPSRIDIDFSLVEEGALLVIADDGCGQLPFKKGFGLKSMNERALMLGGTFQIGASSLKTTSEDSGTAVRVELPISDVP
ncbi:MAG: sensor histidine kinase, partial [Oceanobacter sp.]